MRMVSQNFIGLLNSMIETFVIQYTNTNWGAWQDYDASHTSYDQALESLYHYRAMLGHKGVDFRLVKRKVILEEVIEDV